MSFMDVVIVYIIYNGQFDGKNVSKWRYVTWEGELVSSVFSWDLSLANRAASLNSANLSANFKNVGTWISIYLSLIRVSHQLNIALVSHLDQVVLWWKAQTIDSVCPAVSPLAELLRCLCEGHVGGDSAVDNGLWETEDYQHELRTFEIRTVSFNSDRSWLQCPWFNNIHQHTGLIQIHNPLLQRDIFR